VQDHRILPKLRHHRWMGWTEVAGRPLLAMPLRGIPHVGVGEDTPERYEFVSQAAVAAGPRDFAAWEAVGAKNLARRSMDWKVKDKTKGFLGIGSKPLSLEMIEEFACERILDVATMRKAHELLQAPLLVVAIPVRGIMWARPAPTDVAEAGKFIGLARLAFEKVPKNIEPITPVVFSVMDGKLVGVVSGMAEGGRPSDDEIEPERGFPWPVSGGGPQEEDDEDDYTTVDGT
jgi:hypothetical protein